MADKVRFTFRNQYDVSLAVYTQSSDSHLKLHNIPTGATYMTVETVEECGKDFNVLVDLDPVHCSIEKGHSGKCRMETDGVTIHWLRRD